MTELLKISDIDSADPECGYCLGTGWVCEKHQDTVWLEGDYCACQGAGMPCQCNPLSIPMPDESVPRETL